MKISCSFPIKVDRSSDFTHKPGEIDIGLKYQIEIASSPDETQWNPGRFEAPPPRIPLHFIQATRFQEKLDALGHFYTRYKNIDQLKLHFSQQLDKLMASGFIEFKPDGGKPAAQEGTTYQATLTGNGAIAQGPGATAAGAGGVSVGGDNSGNINTGTQIDTGGGAYVGRKVKAGGNFVGRDQVTYGVPPNELETLFTPLLAVIAQQTAPDNRTEAMQQAEELKTEVAEGRQADDSKTGAIIETLTKMVPGAIGKVLEMFATPILSGIVGPVTKYVLDKLKGS